MPFHEAYSSQGRRIGFLTPDLTNQQLTDEADEDFYVIAVKLSLKITFRLEVFLWCDVAFFSIIKRVHIRQDFFFLFKRANSILGISNSKMARIFLPR